MIFVAHLGYRITGKLFVSRALNRDAVRLFKGLIDTLPSASTYCDIDNNEEYSDIAIVFDIQAGGTLSSDLFSLITSVCKSSDHISTIAITPIDTMLPKIYHFGSKSGLRNFYHKQAINNVKLCLELEGTTILFVQRVLQLFLLKNTRSYLLNVINSLKESCGDAKP
jgi:hypothetical protein